MCVLKSQLVDPAVAFRRRSLSYAGQVGYGVAGTDHSKKVNENMIALDRL